MEAERMQRAAGAHPRTAPSSVALRSGATPVTDPAERRHLLDRISSSWPHVGREWELEEITRLLRRDDARGVALIGGAGVGKTRLARAAVANLVANGFTAEWVLAAEGTRDVPLGAMAHLLPPGDPDRGENLHDLLRLTRSALARLAGDTALVLAIDDVDRLDAASANLVREMVLRSTTSIVVTMRAGATAPDPIATLLRDGVVRRLEIEPIDEANLRDLLSTVLGGDVQDSTVSRLWRTTGGNPLFTRELVVAGVENGSWCRDGDMWRWKGSLGVGTRLGEMVEGRLARLTPSERRHLETLAFAEPISVARFEDMAGIDVVDELERLELLAVARDGQRQYVRLAHPLYGEVLRAATPPLRARSIQRELATRAATGLRRRREDLLTMARWQLAAGTDTDPDLLVQAADSAAGAFDFALAEQYARAAIAAGAGAQASDLLAQGLRGQGRAEEADEIWAAMETAADDPVQRADITSSRAFNLFFALRAHEAAVDMVETALASAEPGEAHHRLLAVRALLALYSGDVSEAVAIGRPLLEPTIADRPRLDGAMAVGTGLAMGGACAEALAIVDEVLPIAFAQPATAMMDAGILVGVRYVGLRAAGLLQYAHDDVRVAYDFAVSVQQHEGMAVLGAAVGQACLDLGDVDQSVRRLRGAAGLLRERDRNGYLPWCLGSLAHAQLMGGDTRGADAALAEVDRIGLPGLRLFRVAVQRGQGWGAYARGDRVGAERVLRDAATWALEVGQRSEAATAMHDLVRIGSAHAVADDLRRLADELDIPLVRAWSAHADAALARDPDALVAVARELESLGARIAAAEAAAQAAELWRDTGRHSSAAAATARVHALLERCPGARPPALPALDETARLTPREREVAVMAAAGMTSRAIAEALFVSVRTVDNHLHHAYEKLGVRDRRGLAAVLDPR